MYGVNKNQVPNINRNTVIKIFVVFVMVYPPYKMVNVFYKIYSMSRTVSNKLFTYASSE